MLHFLKINHRLVPAEVITCIKDIKSEYFYVFDLQSFDNYCKTGGERSHFTPMYEYKYEFDALTVGYQKVLKKLSGDPVMSSGKEVITFYEKNFKKA